MSEELPHSLSVVPVLVGHDECRVTGRCIQAGMEVLGNLNLNCDKYDPVSSFLCAWVNVLSACVYECVLVHGSTYVCVWMWVCMHTCMSVCVCLCMYVCPYRAVVNIL